MPPSNLPSTTLPTCSTAKPLPLRALPPSSSHQQTNHNNNQPSKSNPNNNSNPLILSSHLTAMPIIGVTNGCSVTIAITTTKTTTTNRFLPMNDASTEVTLTSVRVARRVIAAAKKSITKRKCRTKTPGERAQFHFHFFWDLCHHRGLFSLVVGGSLAKILFFKWKKEMKKRMRIKIDFLPSSLDQLVRL